jgi:hypothetical protein
VVAEVEGVGAFGPRCHREARRVGVPTGTDRLSVLGDGAEWIWNLAADHFPLSEQVLDIYHGAEKLAEVAREAFGTGTEAMRQWLRGAREKLIASGYSGVCEALAMPQGEADQARATLEAKSPEVLNYFCGHRERLGYATRLGEGRSIGSGLVEGTIKQRVNVRMKRGSARWLARHVGAFVELSALSETVEWAEYWRLMAA